MVFIIRETNQNVSNKTGVTWVESSARLLRRNFHSIGCRECGVTRLSDDENYQTVEIAEINFKFARAVFYIEIMHHNGAVLVLFYAAHAPHLWHSVVDADKSAGGPVLVARLCVIAPAGLRDGKVIHGETEIVYGAIILHCKAQQNMLARVGVQVCCLLDPCSFLSSAA